MGIPGRKPLIVSLLVAGVWHQPTLSYDKRILMEHLANWYLLLGCSLKAEIPGRSRMWKTNSSVNLDENYHFWFEFCSWSSVATAREHCLVASKRDTIPPVAVREEEMGLN